MLLTNLCFTNYTNYRTTEIAYPSVCILHALTYRSILCRRIVCMRVCVFVLCSARACVCVPHMIATGIHTWDVCVGSRSAWAACHRAKNPRARALALVFPIHGSFAEFWFVGFCRRKFLMQFLICDVTGLFVELKFMCIIFHVLLRTYNPVGWREVYTNTRTPQPQSYSTRIGVAWNLGTHRWCQRLGVRV